MGFQRCARSLYWLARVAAGGPRRRAPRCDLVCFYLCIDCLALTAGLRTRAAIARLA